MGAAAGRDIMTLFVAARVVHVDGRDRNSGVSRLAGAGVPLGKYNQLRVTRESSESKRPLDTPSRNRSRIAAGSGSSAVHGRRYDVHRSQLGGPSPQSIQPNNG